MENFITRTNNFSEAEENLSEALRLGNEINSLSDLNIIYGELSSLYYKKQEFKKAYEYHEKYKIYSDSLYALSNSEKLLEIQTKQELRQKERETELLINENELQKKDYKFSKDTCSGNFFACYRLDNFYLDSFKE